MKSPNGSLNGWQLAHQTAVNGKIDANYRLPHDDIEYHRRNVRASVRIVIYKDTSYEPFIEVLTDNVEDPRDVKPEEVNRVLETSRVPQFPVDEVITELRTQLSGS